MEALSREIKKILRSSSRYEISTRAHKEVMSYARPIAKAIRENPPEGMKESGVLLLLYPNSGIWHSVLIKRTSYKGVHSAQVALPGGKKESTDKSLQDTALREAWEEVGVPISDVQIIGNLSEVYIPPSNFLVSPSVGIVDSRPDFFPQEREVDEILEMQIQRDLLGQKPVQFQSNQSNLSTMKGFWLNDHLIWGATAMILNEFRHLMLEHQIEL